MATFIAWADADTRGEERVADFYVDRFRDEFRPAFDAWMALDPLTDPDAPPTPFAMEEYQVAAQEEAAKLDTASEASAAEVRLDIERSSSYVLTVVLYAVVLFFAGMSTRLRDRRLRWAMTIAGCVVAAGRPRLDLHLPGQPGVLSPSGSSASCSSRRERRGTIGRVTSSPVSEQRLHDLARLRRVRDRIDREYAQPLDVEALARGAHMSAGHLSRQFRLAYGESPYGYLMTRRIERAMALLRRGDLSVTEVCFAVGCSSLGTFSTRFTELVGVPPSTYRGQTARPASGMPPCVAKQVTRPIRNREAPAPSRT